jgi:hypothetical protein
MKQVFAWATVAAAACFVAGCPLYPSPTDMAVNVERLQCEPGKAQEDDAPFLRSVHMLAVGAEYSLHMSSGISKVTGTRIVFRPPDGVTSDRMTRVLQCHSARALLGRVDATKLAYDPYFLPDAWVVIDVKSQDGNYVAELSADTVSNNLRILHRANEFMAAQQATESHPGL